MKISELPKFKLIFLILQMVLTFVLLFISVYLLIFVISNNLGGWMITSYIFIIISIIAMLYYGFYGYKSGIKTYQLSILPYLVAILINVMLPNRNAFQIGVLATLLAFTFGFLLRQKEKKFTLMIGIFMIIISLTFSIYSAITANVKFLGDISSNFLTYLSMYLSIFIPTIMSVTIFLTYYFRIKEQ